MSNLRLDDPIDLVSCRHYSREAEAFTLSQLQALYENILARSLDKRNFRRKMLSLKILEPTGDRQLNGRARPAKRYRFSAERFENLRNRGILFPF